MHRIALAVALMLAAQGAVGQGTPELFAETSRPNISTFAAGEPVIVHFTVTNLAPDQTSWLSIEVRDENGRIVTKSEPVSVTGNDEGDANYAFSAPAQKLGYYEVHASLPSGATLAPLGTRPEGFISYAVVPDPLKRKDYGAAHSHFGMQGGFNFTAPVIPYLGVRYVLAGNDWATMEPASAGEFARNRANPKNKVPPENPAVDRVLYKDEAWRTYPLSLVTRASLPVWAMKEGTGGTICKSFGALSDAGVKALPGFAFAQAKAFAQDHPGQNPRYYQVTWEPAQGWCFGGSDTDLVKLYSLVYGPIHRADPHAVVAGPTLFPEKESAKQLDALLAAGLGKYLDAFSLHPYMNWPAEKGDYLAQLHAQLGAARKAAGRFIPFIGTEHGGTSEESSNLDKALGDIRSTLMLLGEGEALDMAFYSADFREGADNKSKGYGYYWNLNPRINFGSNLLGPKIVVPAYAAMTYLLDGSASQGPAKDLHGMQMGYAFKRGGSTTLALWDYGSSSDYAVAPGSTLCDWMGNCSAAGSKSITLGPEPVYIVIKRQQP